jgi:hypothetical protein
MAERSWLDVCRGWGEARGVDADVIAALDAFSTPMPRGGPPVEEEPWGGSFEALQRAVSLADRATIEAGLADVDPAQAALFARRVHDVAAGLEGDAGGLLRVGLGVRLRGMLAAPGPRALRVRALADYYYSQGARLRWRSVDGPGSSLEELGAAARWSAVAAGVERARIAGRGPDGPLEVALLRVDPGVASLRVLHRPDAAAIPFSAALDAIGAVAGVSGGFFLYSEPDIVLPDQRFDPVGLLLQRGAVQVAPWSRRGALLWRPGTAELRPVGVLRLAVGGRSMDAAVWTRAQGTHGPDVASFAVARGRVVAVGRGLLVPLNGAVVEGAADVDEDVVIEAPKVRGQPALEGIAGGPMLRVEGQAADRMRDEDFWGTAPPVTFSQDETGGRNLLPRHGVGQDAEGRLVFAAVDGRDFERSLGLSLDGLGDLLAGLGCPTSLNLDGGSSKRMVIQGEVVDRASTEVQGAGASTVRVRPVHTAIAIFGG